MSQQFTDKPPDSPILWIWITFWVHHIIKGMHDILF